MIRIFYTDSFVKSVKRLPFFAQTKLIKNLSLLQENPFHSLLHTKALGGKLTGFYSFRITHDWRVIFQFLAEDRVKLTHIGHRKDIYK